MEEEIARPHEHKTFERELLHTVVYQLSKDGRPISYQRLYKNTWAYVEIIMRCIDDFYSEHDDKKLCVLGLSELSGISRDTVRRLIIIMAAAKKVIIKKGDRWKVLHDKPLLVLQQKPKHVDKKLWGKRTPIYVLPFDPKYFGLDRGGTE